MIPVILIGLWCFVAMVAGLVVGEGVLREGGLAGVLLCAALAVTLDLRARHKPEPLVEAEVDPFDAIDWHFPPRIDDRRTVTRERAA